MTSCMRKGIKPSPFLYAFREVILGSSLSGIEDSKIGSS